MARIMDWEGDAGAAWAEEWARTDRSFGTLTDRLLERTRDFDFSTVLDIGCGAGELALAIARGRPETQVVGVDISADLIEAARRRGANIANAEFFLGNAAAWSPEWGFRPDLLVSRHGVMFFDDPVGAFAHLRSLAADGASLMFSCFRGPDVNEIFTGIAALLPPRRTPPDPRAAAPMAFADPEHVNSLLSAAGWTGIAFEAFDFGSVVGAGPDPVADAVEYFLTIGPAAEAIAVASEQEQEAFRSRLRGFLSQRLVDGLVVLRAGAWIVTARAG